MNRELETRPSVAQAPPARPRRELFDGSFPVFVLRLTDGSCWISWESVTEVCRAASSGLSSLVHMSVPIWVEVDGQARWMRFVSRANFLGMALISERFPEFRRFAVGVLERLEDQGVAVAPDVASNPAVRMAQAVLESAVQAARAESLARETAARQDSLERSHQELVREVADNTHVTRALAQSIDHGSRYLFAMPFLRSQGVDVPKDQEGRVGSEIVAVAHELGDFDAGKRKKTLGSFDVNTHTRETLLTWINRNRGRPDRRHWFPV